MTKTVIKLENISKKYGSFLALDKINLEVQNGEVIGLIGPNGAGKTTTLKLIAQLLKNLKSIELNFQVLNPIPSEMLGALIKRLTQNLEPYLDKHSKLRTLFG